MRLLLLLLLLPLCNPFVIPSTIRRTLAFLRSTESPDVIIVGAGLGGLVAANVLTKVHKKSVLVLESHYLAGGCAHTFPIKGYEFESGPTILLGCVNEPKNPLQVSDRRRTNATCYFCGGTNDTALRCSKSLSCVTWTSSGSRTISGEC